MITSAAESVWARTFTCVAIATCGSSAVVTHGGAIREESEFAAAKRVRSSRQQPTRRSLGPRPSVLGATARSQPSSREGTAPISNLSGTRVTSLPPLCVHALGILYTDWMTTPDGVSRCRLAPLRDLVFTTPTGKGA
eukprot:scaffold92779_cov66-Phaeocystis_antarctica.AAC.2